MFELIGFSYYYSDVGLFLYSGVSWTVNITTTNLWLHCVTIVIHINGTIMPEINAFNLFYSNKKNRMAGAAFTIIVQVNHATSDSVVG